MKPESEVQFGPNADGWSITFGTVPTTNEMFDFVVRITGPNCEFSHGTYQYTNLLAQFASELAEVFRILSGSAILQTDHFDLKVTVLDTGQLRFLGNLVRHQFGQFPIGHVRMEFEQSFDPITIESAVKELEQFA